jgi:hypothetical protein
MPEVPDIYIRITKEVHVLSTFTSYAETVRDWKITIGT